MSASFLRCYVKCVYQKQLYSNLLWSVVFKIFLFESCSVVNYISRLLYGVVGSMLLLLLHSASIDLFLIESTNIMLGVCSVKITAHSSLIYFVMYSELRAFWKIK